MTQKVVEINDRHGEDSKCGWLVSQLLAPGTKADSDTQETVGRHRNYFIL